MLKSDDIYISALNRVLDRTDYLFLLKSIRGVTDMSDPWYDFNQMKQAILLSESDYKRTLLLLHMGIGASLAELTAEIGPDAGLLIESGLWKCEDEEVRTDNYVVMYYQGLKLVVEVNPWYETCTRKNTDVYIGLDSLRLAEQIVYKKGTTALDLCSGSGIQGLLAAKSADKVVSVELNEKAVPVTRFNIRLNGMENTVDLRQGDLYSVLKDGEAFDFIYANPPFIPMMKDTVYPVCGAGGEDGLTVLRGIVDGFAARLKDGGEAILFCECLGDRDQVFFDREISALLEARKGRGLAVAASRIPTDLQLERVTELTGLFDDAFVPEAFRQGMRNVYEQLGATYLYSLVYKLDLDGSGTGLKHLKQFNPWDPGDYAVPAECEVRENGEMFDVLKNGKRVGMLNAEAEALLEALKDGLSVSEASKRIFPGFGGKKKYRYGYPDFLFNQLSTCLRMEKLRLIRRAEP